jgi:FKBP-type peptidyl-prolyl cis-trans isomerase SlyD
MSATVAKDKVVTIHYTLKDSSGDVLDSSREGDPLQYLHGHGGIVPGLERAMEGKAVGATLEVKLPPKDGYGEKKGPGPQEVPRDAFEDDAELEAGMPFAAMGPGGRRIPMWVVAVTGDKVLIDTNHPLAGQTLHFDVEVVAIRDATKDELSHGHAHGPHGHGHGHDH